MLNTWQQGDEARRLELFRINPKSLYCPVANVITQNNIESYQLKGLNPDTYYR